MVSERRSRKRVVALCRARNHCFMSAGRKLGGQHDWHLANHDTRRVVRLLGAVWVSSEADRSRGPFNWRDTYRVSLTGRTLGDVAHALRMAGVYDPPTYGYRDTGLTGRETMPTGSGERSGTAIIRERQAAERRKESASQERDGLPALLLVGVFGDSWRAVLASAQPKVEGDYPQSWFGTGATWLKLCRRYPWLPTAWHHAERMLTTDPTLWAARAFVLEAWCRERSRDDGTNGSADTFRCLLHAPALSTEGRAALSMSRARQAIRERDRKERAGVRKAEEELNARERAGGVFWGHN